MKIIGTGSALPKKIVTNQDLSEFLDTNDEWISTRTGIRQRHIIADETLMALSGQAARAALENADITAESIDLIICSTVLGEYITPSLACMIQGEIGAKCPSFDINAACSGFVYALDMAHAMMVAGRAKRVLVVCGEQLSRIVDWTDRSTCILFGDAAAAVVLEADGEAFVSRLSSDSNGELIYASPDSGNCPFRPHTDAVGLQMQGQEVFKFAVASSVSDLRAVCEQAGVDIQCVDYFLLHQANARIIKSIGQRLGASEERLILNIEGTANVSSATIPLMLDQLNRAGRLKKGDLLAMSAFGAGLTTGACLLRW